MTLYNESKKYTHLNEYIHKMLIWINYVNSLNYVFLCLNGFFLFFSVHIVVYFPQKNLHYRNIFIIIIIWFLFEEIGWFLGDPHTHTSYSIQCPNNIWIQNSLFSQRKREMPIKKIINQ